MKQTRTDPRTWSKAFGLYLAGKTYDEICTALSIPRARLAAYASRMGWSTHRSAIQESRAKTAAETFRKIQEEHIESVARRHLSIATTLDRHIVDGLAKKKVGARTLKDLSSTFVNSASVAAKIVGIDKLSSQAPGKPLLIQFNMQVNGGKPSTATIGVSATESNAASEGQPAALPEPDPF